MKKSTFRAGKAKALLAACMFALTVAGPDARAQAADAPFPAINHWRGGYSGQGAIDVLGDKLPAIAAWYGWSEQQLRAEFLSNNTISGTKLRIDQTGRLYMDEVFNVGGKQVSYTQPLFPLEQTFELQSKPGAARTIALVFKSVNGINPFDLDGNRGSFSEEEQRRIQHIWARVAEDFSPFDVNVTTADVADDLISRSGPDDTSYGMAVQIYSETPGYGPGARSASVYLKSFAEQDQALKNTWVNAIALNRGDSKAVAEAVSHLLGHALGLRDAKERDPNPSAFAPFRYYAGVATPQGTWAPIMGWAFGADITQFSRGEYAGASQKEHSFTIMERNGLPLRKDDVGQSRTLSEPLMEQNTTGYIEARAEGVLERADDVDTFRFNAGVGYFTAIVSPKLAVGSNTNFGLRLYNANGGLVASADHPFRNQYNVNYHYSSISFPIGKPGTYYLQVRPIGAAEPGPDGLSRYGNRGTYQVSAAYGPSVLQAPTAEIAAFHFGRALEITGKQGIAGAPITFEGNRSRDDKRIVRYAWDFGDGTGVSDNPSSIAEKTFSKPGTYTISLRVTDADGLSSIVRTTLTIVPDQNVSLAE